MSEFIPYDEVEKKQILNILTKVADGRVLSKSEEGRYKEFTKKTDHQEKAITQAEISEHLDLARPNVSEFLKKKDIKKPYNLDEIRKIYIRDLREKAAGRYTEGDLDPMQERARKDKAMADKYERENAIAQGKLHDGEEVTQAICEANLRAKTRLLRLPREIAIAVPKECAIEAEQEAKRAINEALDELASERKSRRKARETRKN